MPKKKTTAEFVKAAKQKHGSKYDYSKVRYVRSSEKVTIICREHGEFPQSPNSHLMGSGCRSCKADNQKKRRWTTQIFKEKARQRHGETFIYDEVSYVNSKQEVIITCRKHGNFPQIPSTHLRASPGAGCRKCSDEENSQKRISQAKRKFNKHASEIHNNFYDYSQVDYKGSTTKVVIICPKHGEFKQTPNDHLSGCGCELCGQIKKGLALRSSTEEFRSKAEAYWGDRYDYSETIYSTNQTKVTIMCPRHGPFLQRPAHHLRGHGCEDCKAERLSEIFAQSSSEFVSKAKMLHGDAYGYDQVNYVNNKTDVKIFCKACKKYFMKSPTHHLNSQGCQVCSKIAAADRKRRTTKDFIDSARLKHGGTYGYEKVEYLDQNSRVLIKCRKHGFFKQSPKTHLSGGGCKYCLRKGEAKLRYILESVFNLDIEPEYRLGDRFFDFLVVGRDLLIERDGEQHYQEVHFGGQNDASGRKQQTLDDIHENDQLKTRLAKDAGFQIARIPFWLTDTEVETEIENILLGKPTYPDVPEIKHLSSMPRPKTY